MTLRELLGDGPDDVEITGLAYDNRKVEPGTLFFCVPGFTRDGHDFAPGRGRARGGGARGLPAARARRARGAGARTCGPRWRTPRRASTATRPRELRVVGVTGTSGKTTSAWLVRAMLEAAGMQSGLLGTVTSIVGGEARPVERTTPEAIDLQRTFREMLDAGDVACAMEISSHALELRRAEGIHCAASVFTNLSQDHLDFHPDMESYFLAKRQLFEIDPGVRIACADDPYGRRLAAEFPGTRDVRDRRATPTCARSTCAPTRRARTSRCARPTASGRCGSGCPGASTCSTRSARGRRRARSAPPPEPLLATLAEPPRVPGPLRARRRGPAVRGRRRLLAQAGRARERAAVGARGRRGPRDRRLRRGRRPRRRQAPADGGDRGAAGRPGDRDLRQPALGGSRRRSSRRSRRGRAAATSSARSTAARRSPARSGSRGRATSS